MCYSIVCVLWALVTTIVTKIVIKNLMLGVEGRMGLISGPILGGMLESVIFTLIFGNSVYSIVNLNMIVLCYISYCAVSCYIVSR